jgi:hypothetical protein
VDTGALVSVLSSALAQKWFPDYPYAVCKLQGIGNQQVQAKMLENVTFRVGDKSFTGRIHVADIPDDMLIGIDAKFHRKNKLNKQTQHEMEASASAHWRQKFTLPQTRSSSETKSS